MASRWLLKTEPGTYSFDQLARELRTRWDGVRSPAAQIHLRAMRAGDEVLIYHSGEERAVVGVARVATGPHPDPTAKDPRLVAVEISHVRRLARPVPLAAIKADARFREFPLVRISRLSVMPVNPAEWRRILELGGE